MKRISRGALSSGAVLLSLCTAVSLDAQSSAVPVFDAESPQASFAAMAEYLAADGGQWRSPNPNHDATRPNSPPAFGLWFEWVQERRVLELSIVVHRTDRTVVSSKGHWVWHPGEERLEYLMVGRNGSVTEGVTEFPDASTFTTVATFFGSRGNSRVHRDVNVLVSESVHRNETFQWDEAGEWQSQGVYEWSRVEPQNRSGSDG